MAQTFKKFAALILYLAVAGLAAMPSSAHDQSLSSIRLIVRQRDVLVSVSTHISRLGLKEISKDSDIENALSRRIHIEFNARPVEASHSYLMVDRFNDLATLQFTTENLQDQEEQQKRQPATFSVSQRIYPEDRLSQTVVSVVRDGQTGEEFLLNQSHPSMVYGQPYSNGIKLAFDFIEQGLKHIYSGADHILFVIGLIITGGGIKALIAIVTAFTIAHSLTLSLTALHILSLPSRLVEPAIALSIAVIALENWRILRGNIIGVINKQLPYIAFFFGLIHGCGFASALSLANLNPQQACLSLFSFNLGVEIGQASIIVCTAPVVAYLIKNNPVLARRLAMIASILIGVTGVFWFVQRLY